MLLGLGFQILTTIGHKEKIGESKKIGAIKELTMTWKIALLLALFKCISSFCLLMCLHGWGRAEMLRAPSSLLGVWVGPPTLSIPHPEHPSAAPHHPHTCVCLLLVLQTDTLSYVECIYGSSLHTQHTIYNLVNLIHTDISPHFWAVYERILKICSKLCRLTRVVS